ncbi:ABC transporter substrate-binding protein [Natrinema amylolyticum]|uniref:ABC transporter substrate-binding protein n=1 Tax=Natrinema amylolyticum TaxID=2878679 RepID=UPI001CFB81DD|nr:ABC transporter substrate-binding protein [Natrinema amylolyticum]
MSNESNEQTRYGSGIFDRTDRRTVLRTIGAGAAATSVAGCLGGGGSGDTIKIGHIMAVETDNGLGSERSAQLAVDQLNENGGILDQDVELVTADSAGQPSEAHSAVTEMISRENIQMLVGTIVSEVALSLVDLASENDLPFMITGAASPRIFAENHAQNYDQYKSIFRPGPVNSIKQAEYLAEYGQFLSEEHGWDTMAVVSEDAAWTQDITDITAGLLEDNGIDVSVNERVALDTNDWTPILDQVESSGAQAMIGALSHIPITGMTASWSRNEYPFSVDGVMIAAQSPQFWSDTDGTAEYLSTATAAADGFADITPKTSEVMDAYQAEYDSRPTTPTFVGFITHDAINLYAEAVERAGTANHQEDIDAIVEELQATDFQGSFGQIQFQGEDDEYPNDVYPGESAGDEYAPFTVTQWQTAEEGDGIGGTDGTKRCVWPETYQNGDHQPPSWM